MTIETVLIRATLEGDYGIRYEGVLHVRCEVTPADTAPRDAYGQGHYPDSPEQVEVTSIALGVRSCLLPVDTFDHPSIEAAVLEELAARRERNKEDAV